MFAPGRDGPPTRPPENALWPGPVPEGAAKPQINGRWAKEDRKAPEDGGREGERQISRERRPGPTGE